MTPAFVDLAAGLLFTLTGLAVRCHILDQRSDERGTALAEWKRTALRLRHKLRRVTAERDHAVWELGQAKRVARRHVAALEREVADWQAIARGWQDRCVEKSRPALPAGEAAVQAAVAGLDEQYAALMGEGTT